MSLFSALNVALSGLNATMTQMQVAANNIANASNAGYTRKSVLTQAVVLGREGGGTQVYGFDRATNDALVTTLNTTISEASLRSTQSDYLEQLQNILGTTNSSNPPLSSSISEFAAAWRELESAPESNVNQMQVIQAGSNLVSLLHSLSASIDSLDVQCRQDTVDTVNDLNGYLNSVVDLNNKISLGLASGEDVGALQDERDNVIQKIAAITNVKVMDRSVGKIALYTPGGYMLVDGDAQSFTFDGTDVTSLSDPSLSLNSTLTGGKLQALIGFGGTSTPVSVDPATNVIQKIRSQLNEIVSAFTDESLGPPASFASAYNGVAEASQSGCITFQSTVSGTFGNGITVTIGAGTAAGTKKATVHIDGGTDEVFDNIAGTGNAFWVNLADAINNGQVGPPAVDASRLITATAGSGTTTPAATYTLSGGLGNIANGTATNDLMNNGIASATVQSNCLNLQALATGTDGNNVSFTIANGSAGGLYTVTITDGVTTESYEDIPDGGGGNALWVNIADAINNGGGTPAIPASTLVSATAGTGTAAPVLATTTLAGGGDTTSTCLSFYALDSGTAANGVSVAISAGSNAGTYKITISGTGFTTETYDNIDNSGSGFWVNAANAINSGQVGPPAVDASRVIMATAGSGTSLPSTPQASTLSGGTDELLTGFFTGTNITTFAVNANLLNGTQTIKTVSPNDVTDAFNAASRTFTADGLNITSASYETFASSIISGFQQASVYIDSLSTTATDQQQYLNERLTNETGVNVDTETVFLTTLQNAYAASAHVIQTINKLFDILDNL